MRNLLTAVGLATLITAMLISPPVAGAVIVVGTLAAVLVGLRNTEDQPVIARDRPRVGVRRAWLDSGATDTLKRLWPHRTGSRYLLTATRRDGHPINTLGDSPTETVAVYDRDDLRRRLDAAKHQGEIDVSWRRARTGWAVGRSRDDPLSPDAATWSATDADTPEHPPAPVAVTEPDTTDRKEPSVEQEENDMSIIGTGGRASIAGLVTDWETSVEAREHPETFIAWLHAQAQAARQRAQMVPDLVAQYHGRGPSGHAGVPDQQIVEFSKGYEESASAEADAYDRWAGQYAAYVEAAEEQMTHEFGKEVIGSAHAAHRG